MKAESDNVGERMLTLDKVAELLSVAKRTVYRLIAQGVFPKPLKVGHSVRIPVSDVSEYIERLKQER